MAALPLAQTLTGNASLPLQHTLYLMRAKKLERVLARANRVGHVVHPNAELFQLIDTILVGDNCLQIGQIGGFDRAGLGAVFETRVVEFEVKRLDGHAQKADQPLDQATVYHFKRRYVRLLELFVNTGQRRHVAVLGLLGHLQLLRQLAQLVEYAQLRLGNFGAAEFSLKLLGLVDDPRVYHAAVGDGRLVALAGAAFAPGLRARPSLLLVLVLVSVLVLVGPLGHQSVHLVHNALAVKIHRKDVGQVFDEQMGHLQADYHYFGVFVGQHGRNVAADGQVTQQIG
ncbi:hypothetical protein BpHYR1_052188 [Brachionus plicatilis]|uniref:Uncharacterized protein n=1 Tax=Brachionus plicatilis TaxID=10195 RepID=A0A3M7S443_BRAPC|nr:hypothetical protein BpHYR1_052188 [Brachionus plicatilis]